MSWPAQGALTQPSGLPPFRDANREFLSHGWGRIMHNRVEMAVFFNREMRVVPRMGAC
jgi:hypothetical protein